MAQRIGNIYRLVTLPAFYTALQNALGAASARERFVAEVLQPTPGMRVLDCGCGPASMLPFLPKVDYIGIDLNPKHIAFAKEKYGDKGTFLVGDASKLLLDQRGTFDLVLVFGILHHLNNEEAYKLLAGAAELTRPGGRVVTFDPVWLPEQNYMAWIMKKLDSGLNIRRPEGYLELTKELPVQSRTRIYRDLLRIPYDHFCMSLLRM